MHGVGPAPFTDGRLDRLRWHDAPALAAGLLILWPCLAHADGGLRPEQLSFSEFWRPLLAWAAEGVLLLAVVSALGFLFVALHVVLLVFLLLCLWKKSLRGRGVWYSGGALLAC
jgi:hypothetical protein